MILGYFGKTPVAPDAEIVKLASEKMGLPPTTDSPLEMDEVNPKKGLAPAKAALEAEGLPTTEENIFISAACGAKGISFLKGEMKTNVRKIEKEAPAVVSTGSVSDKLTVNVGGDKFTVQFDGGKATVNGKTYDVSVSEGGDDSSTSTGVTGGGAGIPLPAPMPGAVFDILKGPGDSVEEGETVLVLEAMKMEMAIAAPAAGVVSEILVSKGDQVTSGQVLATLG